MDNPKKIKNINLNEGESPEENDILDDLQVLVDSWRKDELKNISPITSLQRLIDDYYSKPLTEMVGGDQEWHTKEQGEFFTLDGSENLGNTDYFKDDGFDIIHQTSGDHHLSDISPDADETYIPKGKKKVKKTILKPRLDKGPFNVSVLDEQEGDMVSGGIMHLWNPEEKKHIETKIDIPKERFFQIVKSLSSNITQSDLEYLVEDDTYGIENAISPIIKLYGKTTQELGGIMSDGLVYKLLFATLDNYTDLINNDLHHFDELDLRPLKKYAVECREDVSIYKRFEWEPTLWAYSENSAMAVVQENEDGQYAYYEWDDTPEFKEMDSEYDSDGLDIMDVRELDSLSLPLTESNLPPLTDEYTITEAMTAVMNHLRRDYSNEELEELLNTSPYNFPKNINNMMKLYGIDKNFILKMIIQFMANNNFEKVDYKKFKGEKLAPLKSYTFIKTFEESELNIKSATIEVQDTNWESALCDATENFWDWEPDMDYLETADQEYVGNEEWEAVQIDGKEVWRAGMNFQTPTTSPYNPNEIPKDC
jgi:hypothetical protein